MVKTAQVDVCFVGELTQTVGFTVLSSGFLARTVSRFWRDETTRPNRSRKRIAIRCSAIQRKEQNGGTNDAISQRWPECGQKKNDDGTGETVYLGPAFVLL